jgi:hypothetical protein
MKKVLLSISCIICLMSCNNTKTESTETVAPSTYTFERNGASSVSFGGQTTRIEMGGEFVSALIDEMKTVESLNAMFSHTEGADNFSKADLNASSKNVRSKVAGSTDFYGTNATDAAAIKADFDSWVSAQTTEVFPNWDTEATAGVAGQIQQAGGGSTRYVSAKGIEYNQLVAKGLIGALMADQILNNYLSPAVLDEASNVADNDGELLNSGKNYTTMEHKWDEAFGYLYGTEADITAPVLNNDSFLNKYLARVNGDSDFSTIAEEIYNAFKLGRAAIVAKDYGTRSEQAEILREKISEVIGVRAVHYLVSGGKDLATDTASAFHSLSEGIGFVYSLQFTRMPNSTAPYFTKAEVDGFMATLQAGNGFWDITPTALNEMAATIAAKFNFTLEQAAVSK